MTKIDDQAYYEQRAAQERAMAAEAGNSTVAAIHAEMAEAYAEKARKPRPKLLLAQA